MKINGYKQYCVQDDAGDSSFKTISGLYEGEFIDLIMPSENIGRHIENNNLRPMHLSVVEFEDERNIGDFIPAPDEPGYSRNKDYADYMRIFFDRLPNWHLHHVSIYIDGMLLYYCKTAWDQEAGCLVEDDFLILNFDYPQRIKMRVNLGGNEKCCPESYIISVQKGEFDERASINIEYYINGIKQYESSLHEDDKGLYEMITDTEKERLIAES